jgi:hypothetical protein
MLTDEKKKLIEKMWGEHYTSGQIAHALSVTRSSVMGYVNRKKLLRNPGVAKKEKKEPKKQDRYIKLISIDGRLIRKRSVTVTPVKKRTTRNTILDLKENHCRFILGEVNSDQTMYCCEPKEKGSYCKFHAEMCYHKPKAYEKREKRKVSGLVFRRPNTLVFKS